MDANSSELRIYIRANWHCTHVPANCHQFHAADRPSSWGISMVRLDGSVRVFGFSSAVHTPVHVFWGVLGWFWTYRLARHAQCIGRRPLKTAQPCSALLTLALHVTPLICCCRSMPCCLRRSSSSTAASSRASRHAQAHHASSSHCVNAELPPVCKHLSFPVVLSTCTVVLQGGPLWTLLPCPSMEELEASHTAAC